MVWVYNKERTLCDILRPNSSADIQIKQKALRGTLWIRRETFRFLSEYTKVLKVEAKLRSYL